MRKLIKICAFSLSALFIWAGLSMAAPVYEYYDDTHYLKRATLDSGEIYEYLNEAFFQDPTYGTWYGRASLIYKPSEGVYRTYDWAGNNSSTWTVEINEYNGIYSPAFGSGIRSNISLSARRVQYFYNNPSGEMANLNTQTNGWALKQKNLYQTDGVTIKESYKYISDDFYIKKEVSGTTYTYIKVNGVWLTNTQLDPDGTATFYQYDSNQVFTGATKYYTSGKVETLNGSWQLLDQKIPSTNFVKGGNLPWQDYGHDIGSRYSGVGFGEGANEKGLINALSKFSGGAARMFLFTDIRDIVDTATMTFYDEAKLYRDMDTLLEAASIAGVKMILTLFDYWLAYGASSGDTGNPAVIKDPAKSAQLINLMGSFINHYADNSNILMWDMMNEPYYGTGASQWGNQRGTMSTVSTDEMKAFLSGLVTTARANDPGKNMTIGFANKEIFSQYWGSFVDGMGGDDVDVVQIHYWAKYYSYSFNQLAFSANDAMFGGKPVLMGEIDPQYFNASDPTADQRLTTLLNSGYSGGLFWQDNMNPSAADLHITPEDLARIQNWYYGTYYTFYAPSAKVHTKKTPDGTIYEYDENGNIINVTPPDPTTIYTYYSGTNRVESKTLSAPDSDGNIYYHYKDENWANTGMGRTDVVKRKGYDSDYALAARFIYSGDAAGRLIKKRYFSDTNMTDLVAIYTEYNNDANLEESRTSMEGPRQVTYVYSDTPGYLLQEKLYSTPPAGTGNVYFNYLPDGSLRPSFETRFGIMPDSTGAYSYMLSYYSTGQLHFQYSYKDQFWGDSFVTPDNPNLIAAYEYNTDGSLKAKTGAYAAPPGSDVNEINQRLDIQNKLKGYGAAPKGGGFIFTSAMAGESSQMPMAPRSILTTGMSITVKQ